MAATTASRSRALGALLRDLHDLARIEPASVVLDAVLTRTAYREDIKRQDPERAEERLALVDELVAAIAEHEPDIIGMSALLTTTMPYMKVVIDTLKEKGMRDKLIVMVGGAPVTQEYADVVGADGYAADASATVKKAKALLKDRRAKVNA